MSLVLRRIKESYILETLILRRTIIVVRSFMYVFLRRTNIYYFKIIAYVHLLLILRNFLHTQIKNLYRATTFLIILLFFCQNSARAEFLVLIWPICRAEENQNYQLRCSKDCLFQFIVICNRWVFNCNENTLIHNRFHHDQQ